MRLRRLRREREKQIALAIKPPVNGLLPMRVARLAGKWLIALDVSQFPFGASSYRECIDSYASVRVSRSAHLC